MDLEGRICGMCDKGKWHKTKDRVAEGVFVDAYQCDKCSEIAYTEEVMRKVEAMQRGDAVVRSLMKIGSSLAVSIPLEIVKRLKLKPKEKVYITSKGNKIIAWVPSA